LNIDQRNKRLLLLALILGIGLMLLKFFAWWVTQSNAILSDAAESIINVVAGAFALYSLSLSAKPRDRNHPYGHGKIEALSAGFEGGLVALAGFGIIAKAIYNLFVVQSIERLDLGLCITVFAGAVNALLGWYLNRKGKQNNSLLLEASGKHLLSDAYSTVGLVLGLGLVYWTGLVVIDNLLSIVLGLFILLTGYRLVRRSVAEVMDELDFSLLRQIVSLLEANRSDDWIDIHEFRIIKYGGTLHFDGHFTLPWYYTVRESEQEIQELTDLLHRELSQPLELFFHIDPCSPTDCKYCLKQDCKVREEDFERRVVWTEDLVGGGRKTVTH
jgi:cation diffusion facilitator family transporter